MIDGWKDCAAHLQRNGKLREPFDGDHAALASGIVRAPDGAALKPEKFARAVGYDGTPRVRYKPLGVVGIISPWNFPWAIPLGEVVMALMAGDSVVLKPSELTPLTGLKIADVFARARLANGLLQVMTGDGSTGQALVLSDVDKIMFTAASLRVGASPDVCPRASPRSSNSRQRP